MYNQRRQKHLEIRVIGYQYHVGFWDGSKGDPGYDFRSLAMAYTQAEAERKLEQILAKDKRYR